MTVEESILSAMEGNDINLVKHLPYILQDFWEIGSSPEQMVKAIQKHKTDYANLEVLDLGSGKGAVSIKIAAELKCKCFGIDAIEDFVNFSNAKARELAVSDICVFETNDVRTRLGTLGKYDIIILGAIGPVFGDYYSTMSQLSPHLKKGGLIISDDAYIEDGRCTDYPNVICKSDLLEQINRAGMEIIDEITVNEIPDQHECYESEYKNIEKRCMELAEKYPESKNMFLEYMNTQETLYDKLSNEVTPVMLVIRQRG